MTVIQPVLSYIFSIARKGIIPSQEWDASFRYICIEGAAPRDYLFPQVRL